MAENRPLDVLRKAALEDARVAAQQLVDKGWPVELNLQVLGPGLQRVEIHIALPQVPIHAQPIEPKGFDWEEPPEGEGT